MNPIFRLNYSISDYVDKKINHFKYIVDKLLKFTFYSDIIIILVYIMDKIINIINTYAQSVDISVNKYIIFSLF